MVESVEQILKLIGQLDDKEREELRRRASRVMAGASRGLLTEPTPNQSDASKAERLLPLLRECENPSVWIVSRPAALFVSELLPHFQ